MRQMRRSKVRQLRGEDMHAAGLRSQNVNAPVVGCGNNGGRGRVEWYCPNEAKAKEDNDRDWSLACGGNEGISLVAGTLLAATAPDGRYTARGQPFAARHRFTLAII